MNNISLLCPSKGRLFELKRMVKSALNTADDPQAIEIVVCMDDDIYIWDDRPHNVLLIKPQDKLNVSQLWNLASEIAHGPIYHMANDDIVFRTQGWDTTVIETFKKYPDGIALVFGYDGDPNKEKNFGPHPFIHENWIKAVGRYLPPYFSGDFVDTWLNDMADGVDRKNQIDIMIEHLHPAFGKREADKTDKDKWDKHWRDDMPQKYLETIEEREADTEKLRAWIKAWK